MSLTLNFQKDSLSTTSGTLSLSSLGGALNLPQGGTSSRPSAPVPGMLRFNTDNNIVEFYNGAIWTSNAQVGGVSGPATTTLNAIPTWASSAGGTIQNSTVLIDSLGNVSGVKQLNANTINSAGTNLVLQTSSSGNILINTVAGGSLILQGNVWPTTSGTAGQAISTNGAGTLSFQSYLQPANNLTDVASAPLALKNLGGRSFKATYFMNSSGTLDSSYFGKLIIINSPGITITMPSLSAAIDGQPITFITNGFGTNVYATINAQGTDTINWAPTASASSIKLYSGDYADLVANISAPGWYVAGPQSPANPNSLVIGSPAGGNLGSGSINAQSIYVNGSLLSNSNIGSWAIITSSGNFTVPAPNLKVTVVGGGASASGQNSGASAGAGGGIAIKKIHGLTVGQIIPVTIGTGGPAGNNSGGSSAFGAYLSATGGNTLGSGGTGISGDLNLAGGAGGAYESYGAYPGGVPIRGGMSYFGRNPNYGAGGDAVGPYSANGVQGVVIIEW